MVLGQSGSAGHRKHQRRKKTGVRKVFEGGKDDFKEILYWGMAWEILIACILECLIGVFGFGLSLLSMLLFFTKCGIDGEVPEATTASWISSGIVYSVIFTAFA